MNIENIYSIATKSFYYRTPSLMAKMGYRSDISQAEVHTNQCVVVFSFCRRVVEGDAETQYAFV